MSSTPKTFFVETDDRWVDRLFLDRGYEEGEMDTADIVVFTGGSDVSPSVYNSPKHPTTSSHIQRDHHCMDLYARAQVRKAACIGICRGAQFLNVMNGGLLYQDVNKHGGTHSLIDHRTGNEYRVSSTHHQMMLPSTSVPNEIVAIATHRGDRTYWCPEEETWIEEINEYGYEVVWYPPTKSLCFQPHPEYHGFKECTDYFFELVERYIP